MACQKGGPESRPISESLRMSEHGREVLPLQAWRQHHEVMLLPADQLGHGPQLLKGAVEISQAKMAEPPGNARPERTVYGKQFMGCPCQEDRRQ
jgi:hypothetical protein